MATSNDAVAKVIFLIEGTAINGAYMPEMRNNYIIPTLEYFSLQGTVDERDMFPVECSKFVYGVVMYKTAQSLPGVTCSTYGPFSNPQRVLNVIDKLDLTGGESESNAHLAEGLATALVCFEDMNEIREDRYQVQNYCILVCNSTPYSIPVNECTAYENKTIEQLAALFHEKNINLSILSPRKIPILIKIFEKADGDMPSLTSKNYSKDPQHLVLLKGFCLKERAGAPAQTNIVALPSVPNVPSVPSVPSVCPPNTNQGQIPNQQQPSIRLPMIAQQQGQINPQMLLQHQQQQQQNLQNLQQQQNMQQSNVPQNIQQQNLQQQNLQQLQANQANQPGQVVPGIQSNAPNQGQPSTVQRERIWSGILEWMEKSKAGELKPASQVPCHVTTNVKDGEPEMYGTLNSDSVVFTVEKQKPIRVTPRKRLVEFSAIQPNLALNTSTF